MNASLVAHLARLHDKTGDLRPGRLWSLLDMLELDASAFYSAVSILRRAQGQMKAEKGSSTSDLHKDKHPSSSVLKSFVSRLTELEASLTALNLRFTKMLLARIVKATQNTTNPITYEDIFNLMEELDSRMRDELALQKLFVISEKMATYYEPATPHFGIEVSDKFPSSNYEIEEAGKCLALRRSTACVTHLMRAIEPALNSLAKIFNVPFDRANWNTILDQVESKIAAIGTGAPPHPPNWKDDKQWYSEAAAHLRLIKDAWRNHAMHLKDRYGEERAEAVFSNVRVLMKHLAQRLSE